MYYIREDEEQRYGRDKSTIVNQSYIEGGEYRRKFDELTKSPKLNRLIYNMAKKMLFHRSGTKFEDMCWIDMETEKVICCKFNEHKTQTIQMTDTISKKLSKYNQIIPIHTHPSSLPPSPADFNCMLQELCCVMMAPFLHIRHTERLIAAYGIHMLKNFYSVGLICMMLKLQL